MGVDPADVLNAELPDVYLGPASWSVAAKDQQGRSLGIEVIELPDDSSQLSERLARLIGLASGARKANENARLGAGMLKGSLDPVIEKRLMGVGLFNEAIQVPGRDRLADLVRTLSEG